MKTRLLIQGLVATAVLAMPVLASAQDFDDIYYNPSKPAQTAKKKTTVKNYVPTADYPAADTYQSGFSTQPVTRDVDEYNRHTAYRPADTVTVNADTLGEFLYTRRLERFHNPDVVTSTNDPDFIDYYYSQPAQTASNVNIYVNANPWYSPYYYSSWNWPYYGWGYNSWYWNTWGPSWAWGPSWSWSWGWGPSWSYYPALCHRRLRLGPSSRLIQRQHPLCLEPSRRHGHRLLQRLDALHWLQRSVSPRQQRHGPVSPRQLRNRRLLPSRHEHHASRQQRQLLRLLPGQLATRPQQLRHRLVILELAPQQLILQQLPRQLQLRLVRRQQLARKLQLGQLRRRTFLRRQLRRRQPRWRRWPWPQIISDSNHGTPPCVCQQRGPALFSTHSQPRSSHLHPLLTPAPSILFPARVLYTYKHLTFPTNYTPS